MDSPLPLSAETLLEHEHFIRSVARGLLGDHHAVDDVAQETWLRTLRRDPRTLTSLRGWLGRVSGNLARDARKSAARRRLREERASRAEAQESVGTAFERLALQRDVVSAILELAEPYRSVVLLRYYNDLEPQEIAARLGAKPSTVRTQLVRAHELLRAKLDGRYRRENWAALLLPVAGALPKGGAGSLKVALLGLGSAAAVALIWVVTHGGTPRAPALAAVPAAAPQAERVALVPSPAGEPAREAVVEASAPNAPASARVSETISPRAELLARSKYDDYEKATFSFELGLRDDPTEITGNDWDVEYTGRDFDSVTIVNDASLIVDLGDTRVTELWAWNGKMPKAAERAKVAAGHTYFVWTRDPDTDLASAFEVQELQPEDRCVLEWYSTADGKTARASFHDASPGEQLAAKLIALRSELRRPSELQTPHVLLQGRNGSGGGGNRARVDIAGDVDYFDARAPAPLDPFAPLERRERALAYCEGGLVPEGKVFVVTRATYWSTTQGSTDGRGAFALVIGGQRVIEDKPLANVPVATDRQNDRAPFTGTWVGRIEVPCGEEMLTYLELCYACAGEVELFGEFVDRPGLIAHARPSPPRAPRPPKPAPPVLSAPSVRLQGRNGAGGGNAFRVNLAGELRHFSERAQAPIDLITPIDLREHGIAYCDGGAVPPGKVFVVTRVNYWGFGNGGTNGGFAVVVGGTRIVEHTEAEPTSGIWTGRIEIPAGAETRTYLELRNSSAGEAILSGEFVAAQAR